MEIAHTDFSFSNQIEMLNIEGRDTNELIYKKIDSSKMERVRC